MQWNLDNLEYALENNWQTIEVGDYSVNVQGVIDRDDDCIRTYIDGTDRECVIYQDGRIYAQDEFYYFELIGLMTNWGRFDE